MYVLLFYEFLKTESQVHQDPGGVGDGEIVVIGCPLLSDTYQPGFF